MKGVWDIDCKVCGKHLVAGPPHGTTCFSCLTAGYKWCSTCGLVLAATAFYNRPDSNGLMAKCISCYKANRNAVPKTEAFKVAKATASRECKARHYATYGGMIEEIQRCHARRAAMNGTYSVEEWLECIAFFDYSCAYCGATHKLTVDHLQAISAGGSNTIRNVVPACGTCNSSKGAKEVAHWFTSREFYSIERMKRILLWVQKRGDSGHE